MVQNARPRPVRPPRPPLSGLASSVGILVVMLVFLQLYARRQINTLIDLGGSLHNTCTIPRSAASPPATFDQMRLSLGALGPMLQPIVNQAPDTQLIAAWQCPAGGRTIWDVILRRGTTPVSVMVMRRNKGDSFPRALGARVDRSTSTPIYQGDAHGDAVASFVSGDYIGYIASALSDTENTALAKQLAPVIARYTQGGAK